MISIEADRARRDTWLGSFHPLGSDTEGEGCLVDAHIATVAMALYISAYSTSCGSFCEEQRKTEKEASLLT